MINSIKNIINSKTSIIDLFDYINLDYNIINAGSEWVRIDPCPFTGSSSAFAVHTDAETGFQMYNLFSSNFTDRKYYSLPTSGTAADLIEVLCPNNIIEVARSISTKTIDWEKGISNSQNKADIPPAYSTPQLEVMQEQYQEDMHLNDGYMKNTRGFTEETLEYFGVGWDAKRSLYSFPIYRDGKLVHFRYNNKPYGKKVITQLKDNNGGAYCFNERDLDESDIVFCEGEEDVMSIHQFRRYPVVGVIGSFGVRSKRHEYLSKRLINKNIYLAFDIGKDGYKYRKYFIENYMKNNKIRIVKYDGNDPDYALQKGLFFEEIF